MLMVLGASHHDLELTQLDRLTGDPDLLSRGLAELTAVDESPVAGVVVVSTCNRLEIYVDALRFHDAIDDSINTWAATRTVRQCVDALIAAGVPAAEVAVDRSLGSHPSLVDRGYFETVDHSVTGSHAMATVPFRFLSTDQPWITRAAPVLGEHNIEVLHELGFTDDEISALRAAKVIGDLPANL